MSHIDRTSAPHANAAPEQQPRPRLSLRVKRAASPRPRISAPRVDGVQPQDSFLQIALPHRTIQAPHALTSPPPLDLVCRADEHTSLRLPSRKDRLQCNRYGLFWGQSLKAQSQALFGADAQPMASHVQQWREYKPRGLMATAQAVAVQAPKLLANAFVVRGDAVAVRTHYINQADRMQARWQATLPMLWQRTGIRWRQHVATSPSSSAPKAAWPMHLQQCFMLQHEGPQSLYLPQDATQILSWLTGCSVQQRQWDGCVPLVARATQIAAVFMQGEAIVLHARGGEMAVEAVSYHNAQTCLHLRDPMGKTLVFPARANAPFSLRGYYPTGFSATEGLPIRNAAG